MASRIGEVVLETSPFRIKICGVRRQEIIEAVGASAADAIGLNFFPLSVRYVDPEVAKTAELSRTAASLGLCRVGVFVNETVDRILAIADAVGIDAIQLHGDEPGSDVRRLTEGERPVIRVIKLPLTGLAPETIEGAIRPWRSVPVSLLLDADGGGHHGGVGKRLDWDAIRRWSDDHPEIAWGLAGGLDAENVSEAVRRSGARAVDVASGVEAPRGTKSAQRINRFANVADDAIRSGPRPSR